MFNMRRLLTISLLGCAAVAFAGLATPSIVSADELSDALLQAHNGLRAKHCVQPLSWSPSLAVLAQEWANHLRDDKGCQLEHSSQERRAAANAGENLAAGLPTAEATVGDWYSEVSDYDFNQPGFQSPSGKPVGHFTQIVWKDTREVGCAMVQCTGDYPTLWVCNYSPAGNYTGQFPDNVLPATCN